MQITDKALFAIISYPQLKEKLQVGAAVAITRRHFCSQMTANNLCTTQCFNCAAPILAALNGVEKADKPAGQYVMRLRHEFATLAEKQEQAKKQAKSDAKKDTMGLPVNREDIFEDLLAGIA